MYSCKDALTLLSRWRNMKTDYHELESMHRLSGVNGTYFNATVDEKWGSSTTSPTDKVVPSTSALGDCAPKPFSSASVDKTANLSYCGEGSMPNPSSTCTTSNEAINPTPAHALGTAELHSSSSPAVETVGATLAHTGSPPKPPSSSTPLGDESHCLHIKTHGA